MKKKNKDVDLKTNIFKWHGFFKNIFVARFGNFFTNFQGDEYFSYSSRTWIKKTIFKDVDLNKQFSRM